MYKKQTLLLQMIATPKKKSSCSMSVNVRVVVIKLVLRTMYAGKYLTCIHVYDCKATYVSSKNKTIRTVKSRQMCR